MEVKLLRVIRLHSGSTTQSTSGYDIIIRQEIFKEKYDGIKKQAKDKGFQREYCLDLAEIFAQDRLLVNHAKKTKEYSADLCIAPSCFGRIFMCHYLLTVQINHGSFYSSPTAIEIDINLENANREESSVE